MTKLYAIHVENLKKIYRNDSSSQKLALDNITLRIPKGSIFGLLGPNGAGKSTFINILADLVKKSSGKVNILGVDHEKDLKKVKSLMGIVPQELNIDPFFTPYELLEIQAGLYGVRREDRRTNEILNMLFLSDKADAYARTLSGGMRRRLLIAKALVHSPEMLILDEPTAGVDIDIRTSVWNYVRLINSKGTTVCLTTHYLEEAENLCDTISIINFGKKIIEGSKKELLNIISTKSVSFVLDKSFSIPEELKQFKPSLRDNILKLNYDKNNTNIREIIDILTRNQIKYKEINTFEGDLEDVFIKVVKDNDISN